MLLKEQLDLGEPSLLGGHNSITKMGGERYHPQSQTFCKIFTDSRPHLKKEKRDLML